MTRLNVDFRQTDDESQLIAWVHEAADTQLPIVLNPAAFTHYSYALRDALAMRTAPLVEVHISNPATREEFRHTSVVAGVAASLIFFFFQKDLGPRTAEIAGQISSYNPDQTWKKVETAEPAQ